MNAQSPPVEGSTLDDRYGTPSPSRRRALLTVCAVLVVAFLGWLGWTSVVHATPDVASEQIAFDIVDEHTATSTVQFDFGGDDVVATCLLRAYADDHTVVGELSFEIASGEGNRVEQTIRTARRATAVESIGCTAPGQTRPR